MKSEETRRPNRDGSDYPLLQILEGRHVWRPALVMSGSVVIHFCYGITRWHALGRAARWANHRAGAGRVSVSRWAT